MDSIFSTKEHRLKKTLYFSCLSLLILMVSMEALFLLVGFRPTINFNSDAYIIGNANIFEEQQQIQEGVTTQSKLKRQFFNIENEGKPFGREQKYEVRVDFESFKQKPIYQFYKQNGIFDRIQIASPYDYANLTNTINFTEVSSNLISTFAYELIEFQQEPQKEVEKLTMKTLMDNKKQYTSIMEMASIKDEQSLRMIQENLAIRLNQNPNSVLLREAEYLMYDIKYNISSIRDELPICIFTTSYKAYLKNKYAQFFHSVNRLNYTNYHIVYIDDNSPSQNVDGIVSFLQKEQNKNSLQQTTCWGLGNMYVWMNKYCNEQDIVVCADSDDWFVGSQVLKVLNVLYQDPEKWFIYSKYLTKTFPNSYTNGFSTALKIPVAKYRTSMSWVTSHLRTFRKKIFAKVPLTHFIQYHLDEAKSIAYPVFMNLANDVNQVFSILQLCGDQRYMHIIDYLYVYQGPGTSTQNSQGQNCFRLHEIQDDYKSRIKISLKKLKSLDQAAELVQNFTEFPQLLQILGSHFRNQAKCREIDEKPAIVIAGQQQKKNKQVLRVDDANNKL